MRYILAFSLFFAALVATPFNKVVIWGHKLHTHTHSYIHQAFYRAFQHLGYETYWLDDQDDIRELNLSNALFITEGQVDQTVPLRKSSYYFLHNCRNIERFAKLKERGHVFTFQVYTDDVLERTYLKKYAPCQYYSTEHKILYMPWATDLLPYEIEENKVRLLNTKKENKVYWVGSVGSGRFGNLESIRPFSNACQKENIPFVVKRRISMEENRDLIMRSYMAPTIVGPWQAEKGYIPCRIFKNISYGQMGVTNSKRTYQLFEHKIIYHSNCNRLFYMAKNQIPEIPTDTIFELMDFVKNNHTYLNRIKFMIEFINASIGDQQ